MTLNAPFTVSPAAEAHLREWLRYVAETVPETAGLIPTLCRGKSNTQWVWRGAAALPEFSDESYSIIYYSPEQAVKWLRAPVAGTDIAIHPDALDRMRGICLSLTRATDDDPLSGQIIGRRY